MLIEADDANERDAKFKRAKTLGQKNRPGDTQLGQGTPSFETILASQRDLHFVGLETR